MASQFSLFDRADAVSEERQNFPSGFMYQPELIGSAEEDALLAQLQELPFRDFEFQGFTGKRRVISFGWQYDFTGRQLQKADDMPDFLLSLRSVAARFAGLEPGGLPHVL